MKPTKFITPEDELIRGSIARVNLRPNRKSTVTILREDGTTGVYRARNQIIIGIAFFNKYHIGPEHLYEFTINWQKIVTKITRIKR